MLAAQTLCEAIDKLKGQRVLVMGDFNAEPKDPVFRPILQRLVSLVPQKRRDLNRAQGSYYFQGFWGYIDHILISHSSDSWSEKRVHVGNFPFLLTDKGTPWRTFQGPAYKGGYSDHLPLYVEIW
jgi:endonuclease/exonuclease/phosphatase family metal-dependent hydrolase